MKWLTVSAGNPERFHVLSVMGDYLLADPLNEWHIAFHTVEGQSRVASLIAAKKFPKALSDRIHLHVSHTKVEFPCSGAQIQREWLEKKAVKEGEWYVVLDDNVQQLRGLPRKYWSDRPIPMAEMNALRHELFRELPMREISLRVKELIKRCESLGTISGSFAIGGNPAFFGRHWREVTYVHASWSVQKRVQGITWSPWPDCMWEDLCRSVQVVARYGSAPTDNWTSMHKTMFEAGGIGALEYRRPYMAADCKKLIARFPGLLRYMKGRDYHVVFSKTSKSSVMKWKAKEYYENLHSNI